MLAPLPTSFVDTVSSSPFSTPPLVSALPSPSSLTSSTYTPYPSLPKPELKSLRLASVSKMLNPSKQLCQYEVPGGGVCRDEKCEDIHLSGRTAGAMEPTSTLPDPRSCFRIAHAIPTRVSSPFMLFFIHRSRHGKTFVQYAANRVARGAWSNYPKDSIDTGTNRRKAAQADA
ncbi:hypothetical protein BD779DRAFT_719169 [Infundibulicybe gibba]|nr:hypothetical protein BD779DRAFT_719169 [Infundibulicybe gibba]